MNLWCFNGQILFSDMGVLFFRLIKILLRRWQRIISASKRSSQSFPISFPFILITHTHEILEHLGFDARRVQQHKKSPEMQFMHSKMSQAFLLLFPLQNICQKKIKSRNCILFLSVQESIQNFLTGIHLSPKRCVIPLFFPHYIISINPIK